MQKIHFHEWDVGIQGCRINGGRINEGRLYVYSVQLQISSYTQYWEISVKILKFCDQILGPIEKISSLCQ